MRLRTGIVVLTTVMSLGVSMLDANGMTLFGCASWSEKVNTKLVAESWFAKNTLTREDTSCGLLGGRYVKSTTVWMTEGDYYGENKSYEGRAHVEKRNTPFMSHTYGCSWSYYK